MSDAPPFVLEQLPDGRREFRAFSDDSDDPIVLTLNDVDARALAVALADALTSLDAPDVTAIPVDVVLDGRRLQILPTDRGLLFRLER